MIFILIASILINIPLHNSTCKKQCKDQVVEMYWADGTVTKTKVRVCP